MPTDLPDYMTPHGYATLAKELEFLTRDERPKITEIVSWAAGNGDRSENGDYIYNKKRLREIDRRIRYLTKKLENAKVVDPKQQQHLDRVFFGAEVTYARADNSEVTVKLVGVDEADFTQNKINWLSPVGRALMKAQVGDTVKVAKGSSDDDTSGEDEWIEVLDIIYRV
ncbi:MAG: transcription elongation factor GreB [Pseudobdellovibrionaceae bacterium]